MNFTKCLIPVYNVIPCPWEITICSIVCCWPCLCTFLVCYWIVRTCIGISRMLWILITLIISFTIVSVVWRESCLEVKTLHEVKLHIDIAEHTPHLTLAGWVLHILQWADLVRELVIVRTKCFLVTRLHNNVAVSIVRSHVRIHTIGMLHGCIVGIAVINMSHVHVEAEAQEIIYLRIKATLEVHLALAIILIDTLLAVIANTNVIVDLIRRALYSKIVVLLLACACQEIRPVVCIARCEHLLHDERRACVGRTCLEKTLTQYGCILHSVSRSCWISLSRRIGNWRWEEFQETVVIELLTAHELWHTCRLCPTVIAIVWDSSLFRLLHVKTTLGYHNHTCSSAWAIDSRWRSILQHVNTLNILWVEPVNVVTHHTINHEERVCLSINWWPTTNLNIKALAHTTWALRDINTRSSALKVLHYRRGTLGVKLFCTDGRNWTCKVVLLHSTVTYNNEVVKCIGIILKHNVDWWLARHVHRLGLHQWRT